MVAVDGRVRLPTRPRKAARILVVDDDEPLRTLLERWLGEDGFQCVAAGSGEEAVGTARWFRPDAVVLDVLLPGIDGLEVMRRLRAESPLLPVLFLTARDAVSDRIAGLTAGGDDYVTKPFSLGEVAARLRALLRRTDPSGSADRLLVVGDLTLDEDSHEVTRAGREIRLTTTEFELLRYLMRNNCQVLTKSQILDRVWKFDFGGQGNNIVQLYISYLRRKIDKGCVPMIHTVRGAGYVLRPARA